LSPEDGREETLFVSAYNGTRSASPVRVLGEGRDGYPRALPKLTPFEESLTAVEPELLSMVLSITITIFHIYTSQYLPDFDAAINELSIASISSSEAAKYRKNECM
jgi:hypothetical protein